MLHCNLGISWSRCSRWCSSNTCLLLNVFAQMWHMWANAFSWTPRMCVDNTCFVTKLREDQINVIQITPFILNILYSQFAADITTEILFLVHQMPDPHMLRQLELLCKGQHTDIATERLPTLRFVLQHVIAQRELAVVWFAALFASRIFNKKHREFFQIYT